eukprot:scaffold29_cov251-Pinguiococcus_pyrenoidosus.AAC.31
MPSGARSVPDGTERIQIRVHGPWQGLFDSGRLVPAPGLRLPAAPFGTAGRPGAGGVTLLGGDTGAMR